MKNLQKIEEFLNEGVYTIKSPLTGNDTVKFKTIMHWSAWKHDYIQFYPDTETRSKFTHEQIIEIIKKR